MTQPKSKSELVAAGTYRRDRHGDRVDDAFPTEGPKPPSNLSETEVALFAEIVASYPAGVLTSSDSMVLAMAVRAYHQWLALSRILSDNPTDYRTSTLLAMCSKQVMTAFSKLGLTPVDRRKLATPLPPTEDEDDPFTQWLKAKNGEDGS